MVKKIYITLKELFLSPFKKTVSCIPFTFHVESVCSPPPLKLSAHMQAIAVVYNESACVWSPCVCMYMETYKMETSF